ncbi:MAG: hypothetical protein BWZ03_00127 [bacterium ADurb.BinA186]|nr:MAG: hypothetical protein BWZ03_00127 [bacterium ADurb.BinA186]
MGLDAGSIAGALGGAKKAGSGWLAKCPIHDDNRASLSITSKGDKILFKCHAGCDQNQLFNEIRNRGLLPNSSLLPPTLSGPKVDISELIKKPETPKLEPKIKPKIVAEYDYTDESGQVLYSAIRYEPKDFRQRAASGAWTLDGVRRVLYRLPEVMRAVSEGKTIYIVEGEKDVHTLESFGLVATCNAGGACKWLPDYSEFLRGASVVIIPDCDDPKGQKKEIAGFKHHNQVLASLSGVAASIKTFIVPSGKDCSDWVDAIGESWGEALIKPIEPFVLPENGDYDRFNLAPKKKEKIFTRASELIKNLSAIEWLIEDTIEADCIALMFGKPGSGKSFMSIAMACAVATGSDFFGKPVKKGSVFYIAGEGFNGIARRLAAWQRNSGISLNGAELYQSSKPMLVFNEDSVRAFCDEIQETLSEIKEPPKLIVIDTFARAFVGEDENDAKATSVFLNRLEEIRVMFGRSNILLVHHSGHGNLKRARGSSNINATINVEYEVEKDESNLIILHNTKMKDAEEQPDVGFRLVGVDLGLDSSGKEIGSAALVAQDAVSLSAIVAKTAMNKDVTAFAVVKEFQSGNTLRQISDNLNVTFGKIQKAAIKMTSMGLLQKEDPNNKKSALVLTEKAQELFSQAGGNLPSALSKAKASAPWKKIKERADTDG